MSLSPMSLSPDQQQRELELRRLIYPPTPYPPVPVQIRASLERQRQAGICFDVAWARAVGHVRWQHDHEERRQWKALVGEEWFVWIWRCAYLRQRHPGLDGVAIMRWSLYDERRVALPRRHQPETRKGARVVPVA
jgi:hypothetical protein